TSRPPCSTTVPYTTLFRFNKLSSISTIFVLIGEEKPLREHTAMEYNRTPDMSNNQIPLKQKTIKGFLWGGMANGIQQVFALLFGIVLGRILMPEDMGIVGILTIFSTVSAAFMESGFVSALTIKKDVKHADYNAVYWLCITIGATLYLLLFFAAPFIADFYEIPVLATVARVSFLNFFISSFG